MLPGAIDMYWLTPTQMIDGLALAKPRLAADYGGTLSRLSALYLQLRSD
jgi:hypothetical protein